LVQVCEHRRTGDRTETDGGKVKPETEATPARIARRHAEKYHAMSNSRNVYSRPLFEKDRNAMLLDAFLAGSPQSFRDVLELEFKRHPIDLVMTRG